MSKSACFNGGNGSGNVAIGDKIAVKAQASEKNQVFKCCQGASDKIVSTDAEYTFIVMWAGIIGEIGGRQGGESRRRRGWCRRG